MLSENVAVNHVGAFNVKLFCKNNAHLHGIHY